MKKIITLAAAVLSLVCAQLCAQNYNTNDYYPEYVPSTKRLDSKSKLCHIVFLTHNRSADVLETLKEVFEADLSAGEFSISQSASSNAIVMRFKEQNDVLLQDVSEVIRGLDLNMGQVLIDVLVVELNVSDDDVFNAEWKELFTYKSNLINMSIDHGSINQNDPTSGSGSGFKAFITSGSKMKAFLDSYQKRGKASVVSSPHIVTANHREATFKTGEQIPLIESTRPSDSGTISSYEVHEIGIELNVTPHINRFGDIDLAVSQTVNSIESYDPKSFTARMASREVKTNLTLSDGQTMVLGGFIEEKIDNIERRVPILSNIPLIGKAFISRSNNKTKTELVVFITPRIITTREEADINTKTMINRTKRKKDIFRLIEQRKQLASPLSANQEVILNRRSPDWLYEFEDAKVCDLVWNVPEIFDEQTLTFTRKGSAPFGFGDSLLLMASPIKTLLKPSEGVVFTREFEIQNLSLYKSVSVKLATNNCAAVYINKRLADEDPVMKNKDGHPFNYWNRTFNLPMSAFKKGKNTISVLLGSDTDTLGCYFDIMMVGNK